MRKCLLHNNKNEIRTKKMITILIWMTGTVVSVMAISLQKETMEEITRDYNGDIFTIISNDCHKTSCDRDGRYAAPIAGSDCKCQCAPSHQIFREDINQCVKDLIDCPLAAFIRPYLTERIPVVSLPVSSGQLIHPGAHLTISGLANLINSSTQLLCQIDSSEMMTSDGWQEMSAHSHMFELYEDGNNTFLQWVGSDSVRKHLHQKLVLVRLSCSGAGTGLYKPCIAIRIGWVPGVSVTGTAIESSSVITYGNKVVAHQSNNYLIIGLCLGLLGLMYVLALMIYIKTKKTQLIKYRNSQNNDNSASNQTHLDSINRMESGNSVLALNNNSSAIPSNVTSSFASDCESYSFNSETVLCDQNNTRNGCPIDTQSIQTTNIANTMYASNNKNVDENEKSTSNDRNSNQNQKISIPERISKRCLQINPEYFEPELLLEPPPPALEFLQRIRELITNAKGRIKNFRFKPTLLVIPEDDYFYQDICKSLDTNCTTAQKNYGFCNGKPIPPPRHGRVKRSTTPFVNRKDLAVMTTSFANQINESECESNIFNLNKDTKNSDEMCADICENSNIRNDFKDIKDKNYFTFEVTDETSKKDYNDVTETDSIANHNENGFLDEDSMPNESFCSQSKISRKEMLMKFKIMEPFDNMTSTDNNIEKIKNNLNVMNKETIISSDNSICNKFKTESNSCESDFIDIEDDTPLDSLKLLSAKVAKKLSEGGVPELSYGCNELEHNEHKMFQYLMKDFRNSFGKLGSKPKPKMSLLKNNDNWTLQRNSLNKTMNSTETDNNSCATNCETQTSDENSSERNTNSCINSKFSTKYNTTSISDNSCECQHSNDLRNNYNNTMHSDFDQNLSLESNENNELNSFQSLNGYECDGTTTDTCSTSSGEVSTTSSFKENLTSLELMSIDSDLTDDSLNKSDNNCEQIKRILKKTSVSAESIELCSDLQEEDDYNPIEVCLKELANTPIDGSHDKYCLRIDRATKGMSALHKIKSSDWQHICVQNDSQKSNKINGYQSDDTTSSTTTSSNLMAFRATDDMTCSNARLETIPSECADKSLSSSPLNCNRRSCRMLGYNTSQDFCSTKSFKIYDKVDSELCANNLIPKPKGSKTGKCLNQRNSSSNHFNKLQTRHPKCTTKLAIYKGPSSEVEFCANFESPANRELSKGCCNGHIPLDDLSSDESNSFVRRNIKQKKLTNVSCKQYIQQRLKGKHEILHKNPSQPQKASISDTDLSKESQNDRESKHNCSNHRNSGSKGTVIEVNDGLNTHFVTRIPV